MALLCHDAPVVYFSPMTLARASTERVQQKGRTRRALLEAAVQLVTSGAQPTVAQVADAAAVSRRTAYRYFPTQEQMLEGAHECVRRHPVVPLDPDLPPERLEHMAVDVERRTLYLIHDGQLFKLPIPAVTFSAQ